MIFSKKQKNQKNRFNQDFFDFFDFLSNTKKSNPEIYGYLK
jgi:hypothetical protein